MSKKSNKDPKNHILAWYLDLVYRIWTKFSMDIVLEHKNKPVVELSSIFIFFSKFGMAFRDQK